MAGPRARRATRRWRWIVNDRPTPGGWRRFDQQPVDQFYRDHVIGGPGAFLMVAEDFDSFAFAIRNKLMREIAGTDGPATMIARGGRAVRSPAAGQEDP
jgi:hypothetical protein